MSIGKKAMTKSSLSNGFAFVDELKIKSAAHKIDSNVQRRFNIVRIVPFQDSGNGGRDAA